MNQIRNQISFEDAYTHLQNIHPTWRGDYSRECLLAIGDRYHEVKARERQAHASAEMFAKRDLFLCAFVFFFGMVVGVCGALVGLGA